MAIRVVVSCAMVLGVLNAASVHAAEPVEVPLSFDGTVDISTTLADCKYPIGLEGIHPNYHDLVRSGNTYIDQNGDKVFYPDGDFAANQKLSEVMPAYTAGYSYVFNNMMDANSNTAVYNQSCITNQGTFAATAVKWRPSGIVSAQHIRQLDPSSLTFVIYRAKKIECPTEASPAMASGISTFGVADNQNTGSFNTSQHINYALSLEQLLPIANNFYSTR